MKRTSGAVLVLSGVVAGVMLAWACGPAGTSAPSAQAATGVDSKGLTQVSGVESIQLEQRVATPAARFAAAPLANSMPTPACKQWQVSMVYLGDANSSAPFITEPKAMPEGWEPFATSDNYHAAVIRRCIRAD